MAIEIVDLPELPMKNGDLPSFFVNVYQRVTPFFILFHNHKQSTNPSLTTTVPTWGIASCLTTGGLASGGAWSASWFYLKIGDTSKITILILETV